MYLKCGEACVEKNGVRNFVEKILDQVYLAAAPVSPLKSSIQSSIVSIQYTRIDIEFN